MTDRIKDLENKAGGYEADRLPYVQVMATLELARQQRETNVQLKCIADLMTPASAQAKDSPFPSWQRGRADIDEIDEALAEVAEHSCTRGIPPQEREAEICHPCTDSDNCIDCIPF